MTTDATELVGKKVRVTLEDDATTPKKSPRERLARALFLLEQQEWHGWLERHNKGGGLLGGCKITYRLQTWEKLVQKHKMHYYNQADTVLDLMKEEQND